MSLITQNPTLDMVSDQPPLIFYLDDGTAVFKVVSDPEGVITANAGSLALGAGGAAWLKTTDGGNTGWVRAQVAQPGQTFARTVAVDTANYTTVGTGVDSLGSITIPANTLTADGQRIKLSANGNFNGAAGNKRLQLFFSGGTLVFNTGLVAVSNANWLLDVEAIRVAGGVLISARLSTSGFGATTTPVWYGATVFAGAVNFALAHNFDFEGECANGADTVTRGGAVAVLS